MAASTSRASRSRRHPALIAERGFALPVVLGVLALMLIFLTVAATRATIGLGVSSDDVASKRALQSARAGLRVALYRMNSAGLDLDQLLRPTQQCLIETGDALALAGLAGDNWCPAVSESLGTGASYTYRVSSVVTTPPVEALLALGTTNHLLRRTIVATGTSDGMTRRVLAEVSADGQRRVVLGVLLVNLIDSGSLTTYRLQAGSFRECRAEAIPSPPDARC